MLDWRNKNDYLFIRELTNEQIAWEYLRRNLDYQKSWNNYNSLPEDQKGYVTSHPLAKKWYLDEMIDPLDDKPNLRWISKIETPVLTQANRTYLSKDPRYIALGFNLELSIPLQLKSAKESLNKQQEYLLNESKIKKINISNNLKAPIDYFRLLDAITMHVSKEEIAKHFKDEIHIEYKKSYERIKKQIIIAEIFREKKYVLYLFKGKK